MQQLLFPARESLAEAAASLRPGGIRSLSDVELVSVLLRCGSSESKALAAAREVLGRGGLADLLRWDKKSLVLRRLGPPAMTVLAATELGRRLAHFRLPKRCPMGRLDQVASYLWTRYHTYDQEVMGALFLDVRTRLIADRVLARGSLTRATVDPRVFLRPALDCGASAMVAFHTHPSGDPAPSAEDLSFTHRLSAAGEVVGVRLLDHVILGDGCRYVSLIDRGIW